MSSVFNISGAASLALHAMSYLAAQDEDGPVAINQIADTFNVSQDHLKKVFQRLSRAGLVSSVRGPRGGVMIKGDPEKITLLDVYEAIEGPLKSDKCLLGHKVCLYKECILSDLATTMNDRAREHFQKTRLSDFAGILKKGRKKKTP